MGQSLCFVLVHIIFSTKGRQNLIIDDVAPRLHGYLATLVRDLECECFRVGGMPDHVHLAVRMKSNMNVATLIDKIKSKSSKWVKPLHPTLRQFTWQRGYGAFSVSPQFKPELLKYIDNQKKHHRTDTFQDEFRRFLKKYDIEYDERYVWD